MRKGSVIALVCAIVLIVVGLALSVAGAYIAAPHSAVYHYGHGGLMYSMRYTTMAVPSCGSVYTSFGHLAFNAGLVLMVIFAVLQVGGHKEKEKDRELDEKERKADRESMKRAKAEAVDATVHEASSPDETKN